MIDEAAHRASAVFLRAHEKSRPPRRRLIMRKRKALEVVGDAPTSLGGIDGLQARGQRLGRLGSHQGHDLDALKQRLEGFPQMSPELDLAGDRAMLDFARHSSV